MGVKTLTIREDVYKKLLEIKQENESFSDVIERLIEKRRISIRDFKGILKDSKVLDDISKEVLENRKKFRER